MLLGKVWRKLIELSVKVLVALTRVKLPQDLFVCLFV